jgi:cytochrome c peroxidase
MLKGFSWGAVLVLGVGVSGCATDDPSTTDTAQFLSGHRNLPNGVPIPNATGLTATVSTSGSLDLSNEFFQNLGTNGRRCVSCHLPTAGWGITPEQVQLVFDATKGGAIDDGVGLGAIFRTNDGSVSPDADVSTLDARRKAYSMLLNHGVIRVSMAVPDTAEFELIGVNDPYNHSSAADLSMFRRPLPSTNLAFLSAVMWDGRETFAGQSIHFDLSDQSNGATQGHAQGNPLTDAQRESIVGFETSLFTAATFDKDAGSTTAKGGNGGPDALSNQAFYIGINDLFGDSHTGAAFNPNAFSIYNAWDGSKDAGRAAVARGEKLFNTRAIDITGVGGINDNPAFGSPAHVAGSCTTCHDTPNAGNHSVSVPLNIGIVDPARHGSDYPVYTFRNKTTGETVTVTDPGRAMISGKWIDIGKFKGPVLRALAARAPYFHDGSADDLDDVVDFYNDRFGMHLTKGEHSDLVAFLRTL